MSASFEEKSVWIQLVGTVVGLGAYFVIAGMMLANGVREMPAFAAVFGVSTVFLVILMVVGHIAAAVLSSPEGRDERDRLIEWRAEAHSAWIVVVGVFAALTGMVFDVSNVWSANVLLASLFISQVLSSVLRLVSYRRGLRGA